MWHHLDVLTGVSDGTERVRTRVVAAGRVQGVFFRDSCRDQAQAMKVAGWVRNLPDGTVEAAFEGSPGAVAAMVGWCRSGPERARVDALHVFPESPEGETSFRVR